MGTPFCELWANIRCMSASLARSSSFASSIFVYNGCRLGIVVMNGLFWRDGSPKNKGVVKGTRLVGHGQSASGFWH